MVIIDKRNRPYNLMGILPFFLYQLLPDFIDAGFDILNPVQCSAAEMDAARLKREFGRDLVFWGGGVDTQQTMAFGTPEQVEGEVRERIKTFNQDGGFVFNAIHNIQGNVPIENVEAVFKAIKDSSKGFTHGCHAR